MAVLSEPEIRARARRRAASVGLDVDKALEGVARRQAERYDIFLSQTIRDAEIVFGVYDLLTEKGYVVFCDWIAAPNTDRSKVTPTNAQIIRSVMGVSDTLLFLDTEQADQSLWMCWELGWFDGENGHVAILPVLPDDNRYYRGREFLGLYPYVEIDEHGALKIVRPPAVSPYGVMVFEAPNTASFDWWRNDKTAWLRPRTFEQFRPR